MLSMGYGYNAPFEEPDGYKAGLVIRKASIFHRYSITFRQARDIHEINAVFADVGFSLGVVPFIVHGLL